MIRMELMPKNKHLPKFKYTRDTWFSFGVASTKATKYSNATGKRCKMINSAGKKIVNMMEWNKK